MHHSPQLKSAQTPSGGYDYSPCFAYVKEEVSKADFAIANLEVPLAGKPYTGYPLFSAPDEYAKGIREAGFDILLTANNHAVDKARHGVVRTLDVLDSLGLAHFGTYRDSMERANTYPLLIEKNNIRIALIGYTYDTNGLPVTPPVVVNQINREQILADIQAAQAMDVDAIIACMHWGLEYQTQPEPAERELAAWMLAQGVDHIVGTHPHVVQPIEVHTAPSDSTERHVVAYSLGNYLSNQSPATTKKEFTDGGAALHLTLSKRGGVTTLSDCNYSWVWVSRPQVSGKKSYRLLTPTAAPNATDSTERGLMDTFLRKARALFSTYSVGIVEKTAGSGENGCQMP